MRTYCWLRRISTERVRTIKVCDMLCAIENIILREIIIDENSKVQCEVVVECTRLEITCYLCVNILM